MTTLLHVPLDLPRELDLVRDVKVDGEVQQVAHALVHEGVEPFDDNDRGRFDLLRGVQGAVDVVVNGLLHGLAGLEVAKVLVHEVEPLLVGVKSGLPRYLSGSRRDRGGGGGGCRCCGSGGGGDVNAMDVF